MKPVFVSLLLLSGIISSAQNVGVGTNTPSSKLHVQSTNAWGIGLPGTILVDDDLYPTIKLNARTTNLGLIYGTSTGLEIKANQDISSISFSAGNTEGSGLMYISSIGRIGIGNTFPQARLHITSTNASGTLRLEDNNSASVGFYHGTTQDAGINANVFGMFIATYNPGIPIHLSPNNVAAVSITPGRMGVGTTTPQVLFDAYTNADVWHAFIGGANGRLQIGGQTTNGAVLQSFNPTSGLVRDMFLQRDGGNVGIGVSTALAKLHVNGPQRIEFNSSSVPHLLLYESQADYARMMFANTNGNSFTLAANRGGPSGFDELNIFSERNAANIFQVSTDPLASVRVNGSLVVKAADINLPGGTVYSINVGDATMANVSGLFSSSNAVERIEGATQGRILIIVCDGNPFTLKSSLSISFPYTGSILLPSDIDLNFGDTITLIGLGDSNARWVCVSRVDL